MNKLLHFIDCNSYELTILVGCLFLSVAIILAPPTIVREGEEPVQIFIQCPNVEAMVLELPPAYGDEPEELEEEVLIYDW